jgi:deoxyadenosine/deoxycytidine kinase
MIPKRAKIVSIDGNIGVGKSTFLTEILPQLFDNDKIIKGIKEPENPWLEPFYKDPKKHILKLQHYFLAMRLGIYKEYMDAKDESKIIFLDRSIFSDVIFVDNALEHGIMTRQDYDVFMQTRKAVLQDIPLPDLVIYLEAPPQICLERIKTRGLISEQGIDISYLIGLENNHRKYLSDMEQKEVKVLKLDWTDFGKQYTTTDFLKRWLC